MRRKVGWFCTQAFHNIRNLKLSYNIYQLLSKLPRMITLSVQPFILNPWANFEDTY